MLRCSAAVTPSRIRGLIPFFGVLLLFAATPADAATPPTALTGVLGPDAAPYLIQIPPPWNGVLLVYSHGYQRAGSPLPPLPADAPDARTQGWLLAHGYGLAASGYSRQGWAVEEGLRNQLELVGLAARLGYAAPRRTIAWGESMGGLITAMVEAHPELFAGGLPMCGVVGGAPEMWNQELDAAFAFRTPLEPDSALRLDRIADPGADFALARSALLQAQLTPAGRPRIALAPFWLVPGRSAAGRSRP